jgi:hypothetical protein
MSIAGRPDMIEGANVTPTYGNPFDLFFWPIVGDSAAEIAAPAEVQAPRAA